MIRADCHVHSSFSSDSDSKPEEMIEKAISLGFQKFYLTDHMDYDFPANGELNFRFSPELYFEKLTELKETYGSKIHILTGIELGLKNTVSVINKINTLLSNYSFDLIIGSTHLVNDLDPYHKEFWEGRSEEASLISYFQQILINIKAIPNIQVLGHLDYAIRYSPYKGKSYSYDKYAEYIDPILSYIIKNNIALEVNTSGFKYERNAPNPGPDVIKRYGDLGGTCISIGSDAHNPIDYAYHFKETQKLLYSLGIKSYTTFEKGTGTLSSL